MRHQAGYCEFPSSLLDAVLKIDELCQVGEFGVVNECRNDALHEAHVFLLPAHDEQCFVSVSSVVHQNHACTDGGDPYNLWIRRCFEYSDLPCLDDVCAVARCSIRTRI